MRAEIQQKLSTLPELPGVYLMKDSDGVIIYVGKAKILKRRVSSYFQKTDHDPKTTILVRNIADFEYIVTDSELEALLLENTLIKKHMPKYNVRLKDDKQYPYIAIINAGGYPRVIYTRNLKGTDRYFGPYTDSYAARSTVETINRLFKLRTCSKKLPLKDGERPCLNYQMKRCSGVCAGKIPISEYKSLVNDAVMFLEGNVGPVIQNLKKRMDDNSAKMEFEQAAVLRDMIFSIQNVSQKQKVYTHISRDQDYIAAEIQGDEALAVLFEFRSGVLSGRKVTLFQNATVTTTEESLRAFLLEYYDRAEAPRKIIISENIDDIELIAEHLTKKSGHEVRLTIARSDEDRSVISLIKKNIGILAAERKARRDNPAEALAELQEKLALPDFPERIVCFDISNIQGQYAVASMSASNGGRPDKKNYRIYNIRGYEEANDPGMIHEAVSRYLQNCVNGEWDMADLILIDGGITQLTRAKEAANALGVEIPIISIAKRIEEIFTDPAAPPYLFDERSPALKILQGLRDEAHRFGITRHRKKRDQATLTSEIDAIPGIGPSKRKILLSALGSVNAAKEASIEQLCEVKGISAKDAETVYGFFHKD
jgi:excinuclease ABC subunit C